MLVDEWIHLDGPLDGLLDELAIQSEKLDTLSISLSVKKKRFNIDCSQVFSDTCSKYFFHKIKGIPGTLRHLFDNSDVLVSTDCEILDLCCIFYGNLYSSQNAPSCKLSNYSVPPNGCYLTDEDI